MRGLVEQMTEHITVGGFHLMHKTLLKKKIQRAINRWRLGLRFSFAQQIKQIIALIAPSCRLIRRNTSRRCGVRRTLRCAQIFQPALITPALWSFPSGTSKWGLRMSLLYHVPGKTPRTLIVAVMLIFCFVRKVLFCLVVPLSTR